jgi:hypothetical protein
MDPSDVAFIKGAVAFALLAATGLGAWWLRLRSRLLARQDSPDLDQTLEHLAQFRSDLDARLIELEERLDFTERRLLQDQSRPRLEERPGAVTPV